MKEQNLHCCVFLSLVGNAAFVLRVHPTDDVQAVAFIDGQPPLVGLKDNTSGGQP